MKDRQRAVSTQTVLQTEITECGAACLSMILRYYGQYSSLEELRLETDVSRDGCSAGNIVRAAKLRGLDCDGFEVDIEELTEIEPPSILWWGKDHFVVYEGTEKDHFLINDPAYGKRSVSRKTMEREFSGILLTFTPTETFKDHPSYGKRPETFLSSGRWKDAFRSFTPDAVKALMAGFVTLAAFIIAAILFREMVPTSGDVAPGSRHGMLVPTLLILLAIIAWEYFRYRLGRWKDRNELAGSLPFLQKILYAPILFIEDRYPEDLSEWNVKNDRIDRFSPELICALVVGGAGVVASIIVMTTASARAAIPLLVAAILSAAVRRFETLTSIRDSSMARILDGNLVRTLFLDAGKRETIRNMGLADRYADRAINAQREAEGAARRLRESAGAAQFIRVAIYSIGVIDSLLMMSGPSPDITGLISWGILVAIFIVSSEVMIRIGGEVAAANEDYEVTRRIGLIVQREEKDTLEYENRGYRKLNGNISVEGLSFGYGHSGKLLLKDLDIDIPGGSTLVITGGTASGKSTLGKLIGGLMEPSEGKILYDGRKATEIPDRVMYSSIASVKQKSTLFPGTIRDNITMWDPNISQKEIDQALADACAEVIIGSRSMGLDAVLGQGGTGLSGGEQQRIEIARALATNPSILILDEAFSAIDDETSLMILDNIRKRGCTCIIITRDPVLIREEMKVLDLDDCQVTT